MYRQIDTGTWDDPWFAELDPDAKLLFLYLLTNRRSTAAGVFEITVRAMAFETGLDTKHVNAALESIATRVQWWPDHQIVWVKNFLRHQAVSPKFYRSAWAEMRDMPDTVRDSVGQIYPILTSSDVPPEKKEDIEALLIPYPKGIDTLSEPNENGIQQTSLDQSSTRPVKTSRLESGADAPARPKSPKGTRLPDDFAVTAEMRAWARSEGATDRLIDSETDKFRDYWPTITGQKGVKANWELTWKNWMRRGIENAPAGLRVIKGNESPYAGRGYDPLRSLPPEELADYERKLAKAKAEAEAMERRGA